jgi:hypothetical protein
MRLAVSLASFAIPLFATKASAIVLLDKSFPPSCNSRLIVGPAFSAGQFGYVFTTGTTAYKLDTVDLRVTRGVFQGVTVGQPSTVFVSLFKADTDNQLIGNALAEAEQAFNLLDLANPECETASVYLQGFQVSANERYFLGISSPDALLWSIWDGGPGNPPVITNGGITNQLGNGLWWVPPTGTNQELTYYGNLKLTGTAIPGAPAPLPLLGLLSGYKASRRIRKRILQSLPTKQGTL